MERKNLLVFASGSATGGGSGFKNLVKVGRQKNLAYNIVGVVTHHREGGVVGHAHDLNIPYEVVYPTLSGDDYRNLMREFKADKAALSGWLRPVTGLSTWEVFNIHPGPLPQFGGHGMHGHHVHEAVIREFKRGKITHSAVCMHFVTPYRKVGDKDNYDQGPLIAQVPVPIFDDDTAEKLGARVNTKEHAIQPIYTSLICEGKIALVGVTVSMMNRAWASGRELPLY